MMALKDKLNYQEEKNLFMHFSDAVDCETQARRVVFV